MELWNKDEEEEVVNLVMMGMRELIITEDPSKTMEVIFGDLHLEGHQISKASPVASDGESIEPGAIATEEVTKTEAQEGENAQFEQMSL